MRLKGSLRFPAVIQFRADDSVLATSVAQPSALPRAGRGPYSELADSVLQPETWPPLKPFWNQRLRCSDVPWVKESGTT